MADPQLERGKLPTALLEQLLASGPALPDEVVLGPQVGEDACAIELAAGQLIATTDPITMTGCGAGGHAVLINANDVAVCGVRPRYFLASVLLPVGTRESEVRALFADMRQALERVGAHLVGGHTEITDAVRQTVVAGQMLGTAQSGACIRSSGARPGDCIVQIGPAPVEGALVLAVEGGERIASVEPGLLERALAARDEPGISVVEAALCVAEHGAHALHDPTEGGLSAGLHELARASGLALTVSPEAVLWFEPGLALCRALGADPWGTLASGTVLAALSESGARAALDTLSERGFPAAAIGTAEPGAGVRLSDGSPLVHYERDELSRVL